MAKKNPALDALRKSVLKRENDMAKKMARIAKANGTIVGGSEFDIRKGSARISRLNSKQLASHLTKVNSFMSRNTQFVPDRERRPIPITEWRQYEKPQKQYNENVSKAFGQIKDIQLHKSGMTIEGRLQSLDTTWAGMSSDTANTPFRPLERQSHKFVSRTALKKQLKQMRRMAREDYLPKLARSGKRSAKKMAARVGSKELDRVMSSLSLNQFEVLWAYSGFANALDEVYINSKNLDEGENLAVSTQSQDGNVDGLIDLAKWAKGLKV